MESLYNVQCLNGHTFHAVADSDLGKRAARREKNGYLDALIVPCEDCDECRYDQERQESMYADW